MATYTPDQHVSRGGSIDYSVLLSDAMKAGASASEVQNLLDQRTAIAESTPSLNQYAYDNVYRTTMNYINQAKNAEAAQAEAARAASALSEYRNAYNSQSDALAQALEQQRAANEAAVQKAVNSLQSQKTDTEAQYADLFRQLYVDKMRTQKNLGQQLAAGGITGGAAESTMLGLNTQYEDAMRQGEQGRISAIGSLDRAISDARLTGDVANAQATAASVKEQADAYADALKYLINRQDAIDARQETYAREDAQRAAAYAQQLAQEQREAAEKAEEEAKKAAKPTLTVAQVNAAIKAGVLTEAVLAAYEYYYGTPYRE
ncbi:MAG: hypothetical protein IJ822_10660 [Pyramidobacter sp.]|nr:hypothetical protein [Pyramidobacter sp.]